MATSGATTTFKADGGQLCQSVRRCLEDGVQSSGPLAAASSGGGRELQTPGAPADVPQTYRLHTSWRFAAVGQAGPGV